MRFRSTSRDDDTQTEDVSGSGVLPFPHREDEEPEEETTLIKTVGWISAGLGAVALALHAILSP